MAVPCLGYLLFILFQEFCATSETPNPFMTPKNRHRFGVEQIMSKHHPDFNPPMPRPPFFSSWWRQNEFFLLLLLLADDLLLRCFMTFKRLKTCSYDFSYLLFTILFVERITLCYGVHCTKNAKCLQNLMQIRDCNSLLMLLIGFFCVPHINYRNVCRCSVPFSMQTWFQNCPENLFKFWVDLRYLLCLADWLTF